MNRTNEVKALLTRFEAVVKERARLEAKYEALIAENEILTAEVEALRNKAKA